MTKKKKDLSQPSLFDWIREAEQISRLSDNPPLGSLDIDSEFRAAVTQDLKHALDPATGRELSRAEVAARMSDLTGQDITSSMLYNWTAESHDRHRMPCIYLPAFVLATGGQRRASETLTRKAGLFALPGPEALRAEIQRLDEEISLKKNEKRKRLLFLSQLKREVDQ